MLQGFISCPAVLSPSPLLLSPWGHCCLLCRTVYGLGLSGTPHLCPASCCLLASGQPGGSGPASWPQDRRNLSCRMGPPSFLWAEWVFQMTGWPLWRDIGQLHSGVSAGGPLVPHLVPVRLKAVHAHGLKLHNTELSLPASASFPLCAFTGWLVGTSTAPVPLEDLSGLLCHGQLADLPLFS